jgi:outer membrane receptor protein involved in Fe transport
VPTTAAFGRSQQRAVGGGNPGLEAETAKVFTAGIVYEPPQVKGLSLTLDYFDIRIKQAIQALGAQVILANCYTRDQDEDCAKIHRDPQLGYAIDYIDDPLINVGGTQTSGIDFAVAYAHEAGNAGRFRHQFEGQYLRTYLLDNAATKLQGVGYYDLGVYPRLKANLSTLWERRRVSAGLNLRYVASYLECQNNDCNTPENREMFSRDVDANVTADLFAGYTVKSRAGTTRLTVGVNNLTDRKPPLIYVGFSGDSDASAYDYMGRYFYARMSQSF